MIHQWFWQTEGEQYGPLSTEELEDLVRRNRVKDADQIRLDGSADWLPAAQVKAMFAGPADPSSPETGAQSAARVLAGIERRQLELEVDEISWGARFAGLVGKGVRAPAAVFAICWDLMAAGLTRSVEVLGRKATLGVILVLLLAVFFRNVKLGDTQTQAAHADLAATFEEMRVMKKRGASKAEWQEFERETLEWLKPMRKSLGESAIRNAFGYDFWPISQSDTASAQRNLVIAGSALAEAIYAEARKPTGQTDDSLDVIFSTRMNLARGFWNGEIKEITTSDATKSETSSVDPLMAGMFVIDVGVVGGVLVFWWKRRRR